MAKRKKEVVASTDPTVITEHHAPSSDIRMLPGWYGFYVKFAGDPKEFEKLKPEFVYKCYATMIAESMKRECKTLYYTDLIIKKDDIRDALDNVFLEATVGIKWQERE